MGDYHLEMPASALQWICSVLSNYEEAEWELDVDFGVRIVCMDGAHVALVEIMIPKASFTEFRVTCPRSLGISSRKLLEMLQAGPSGKDMVATLSSQSKRRGKERSADHIRISLDGVGSMRTEWSLALLQIDAETLAVPEVEWPFQVHMPAKMLVAFCKTLSSVSDTVLLSPGTGTLLLDAKSNGNSVKQDLETDIAEEVDIINAEDALCPSPQEVSLRHLSQFAKATLGAKTATLCINDAAPVMIGCHVPDLPESKANFWLAPRRGPDDDELVE